jgi:transcriptional regulator GlxA family with amidase domain
MKGQIQPLHVSLVAIPEASMSTLLGIHDVLAFFSALAGKDPALPTVAPFTVEIVGAERGRLRLANGLSVDVARSVAEVKKTDIVIVPSVVVPDSGWKTGRYPQLARWAARMHEQEALLCSACSGVFLLAETEAFDGQPTTVHWGYAAQFAKAFPKIPLQPERVLVVAGQREQLVSSGASTSWHDLVLYLIVRYVGATAAQAIARFFALQWHHDGLAPYIVFEGRKDHGDAAVADAQAWLGRHFSVAAPVEEMVNRSGIPERTFKRRFTQATGLAPIDYVQRLRVEDAKRRLERTEAPVDEISWRVGYEDPAFFRRLFKRLTGLAPGAYRRRFQVPAFALAQQPGTRAKPAIP